MTPHCVLWQWAVNARLQPAGLRLLCNDLPHALQASSAHLRWDALRASLTPGVDLPVDTTPAEIAPDTVQALHDAGVALWPPAALHRLDTALPAGWVCPAPWLVGRWFLQPPGSATPAAQGLRAITLRLVQLVAADAETRDIEAVLRQDPTLAYQLLRLVNSAGFGANQPITSFAQALLMLGRKNLARWLNLMLFAPRAGNSDPRAALLMAQVCTRARTLELLAQALGRDHADQDAAFMTGLLSMLDALLGQPLPALIAPLPLDTTIKAALIDQQGTLGALLRLAQAAQDGALDALDASLSQVGLSADIWLTCHLEALAWAAALARDAGATSS